MEASMIIKALECCSNYKGAADCKKCPMHEDGYVQCKQNLLESHALALIKELTEEVESWKKECASRTTVYCELHSKCEKLTEENKSLNDELKKRPKKLVITKLNTEDENK